MKNGQDDGCDNSYEDDSEQRRIYPSSIVHATQEVNLLKWGPQVVLERMNGEKENGANPEADADAHVARRLHPLHHIESF